VPIPRLKGKTKKALTRFVDDIFNTVIEYGLYEAKWIDNLKERVKLLNRYYNQDTIEAMFEKIKKQVHLYI